MVDAGDPVECAERYEIQGADELVLLDITATTEARKTFTDIVLNASDKVRYAVNCRWWHYVWEGYDAAYESWCR